MNRAEYIVAATAELDESRQYGGKEGLAMAVRGVAYAILATAAPSQQTYILGTPEPAFREPDRLPTVYPDAPPIPGSAQ